MIFQNALLRAERWTSNLGREVLLFSVFGNWSNLTSCSYLLSSSGTDQRPAKREERQANTSETAELGEPADDPNVGQDVADDEGEEVAAV